MKDMPSQVAQQESCPCSCSVGRSEFGVTLVLDQADRRDGVRPGRLVLRLCSVRFLYEAQSENAVFSIARTRCRKRNVFCFQFTVVLTSWHSRWLGARKSGWTLGWVESNVARRAGMGQARLIPIS